MSEASSPSAAARLHVPDAATALALYGRHFLNRTDRVAFGPPWGNACPAEGGDNLDALLRAHLLGRAGPAVTIRWGPTQAGNTGEERGWFRIGSYSPAVGGLTRYGVIDADGGGRHAAPLANPLWVALAILDRCEELGIPAHLERSGGGKGWHVWVFFSEPVPASEVRRLLFGVIPDGIQLADGGRADAKSNRGLEVFPKQDTLPEDGTGNLVWLPWWSGASEGGNLFYRVADGGEIAPYLPDAFETVTPGELADALAQVRPPSANGHGKGHTFRFRVFPRAERDGQGRVKAEVLLRRALARAKAGGTGDSGRNATGLWLACQLRDNGYSQDEARPVMGRYREGVPAEGHEYTEREVEATLRSAYARPARQPWGHDHAGRNGGSPGGDNPSEPPERGDGANDCPHLTDRGNAIRLACDHGEDLRHSWPWKKWLVWDGRRWRLDDSGEAARRAKQVLVDLYRWAVARLEAIGEQLEGKAGE
jgi:hypothetical protein